MHPPLARYARRVLDQETANDVATDTLRTIWSKQLPVPEDDDGRRRLRSLCYRICDGHIRNALRAERRRRSLEDLLTARASHTSMVLPDIAEDVAARDRVAAVLAKLPKAEREAVLLFLDGYTPSEIAHAVGCSGPAATMRLARAKEHLRKLLGHRGEGVRFVTDTRRPPT
jgi:RNA polymerase sigma-70 factor (ECF subfamily)